MASFFPTKHRGCGTLAEQFNVLCFWCLLDVQEADTFFTYGGYTQIDASLGMVEESPFGSCMLYIYIYMHIYSIYIYTIYYIYSKNKPFFWDNMCHFLPAPLRFINVCLGDFLMNKSVRIDVVTWRARWVKGANMKLPISSESNLLNVYL